MALITLALAFLCVWSISAQVLHKSIVPKEVKRDSEVTVFCDSDLAGVPENGSPEGIYALHLSWNKQFFLKFDTESPYRIIPGPNYRWRTRISGTYPINEFGFFDREKFRLEIDVIYLKPDDEGEFCCSSYIVKDKKVQLASERCEDFIVTHQSIIEGMVDPHNSLVLNLTQCTPELAGIPDTATEMENMSFFWQNKDFYPNEYFLYTLRTYSYPGQHRNPNLVQYPDVNLIKPRGKDHWHVHPGYRQLKPNMRMDTHGTELLLLIYGVLPQDAGWYCCSVTYFDEADAKRLAHRCHYLSASRIEVSFNSKNGSSIKIVTESLIFGLLIISWTVLHIYRG
ncbi:uncharacterized protein LOC131937875 isoform X2 [Physella acuta]|uniref:uncharacterized protein LOC131937875 isoform X2 n=1 Tax=Physella acuta TaxID=109671 RepID=UPI0027DCD970|nr:uncharacterized protein LOC131937875 isoform X2 [Physella acuta]